MPETDPVTDALEARLRAIETNVVNLASSKATFSLVDMTRADLAALTHRMTILESRVTQYFEHVLLVHSVVNAATETDLVAAMDRLNDSLDAIQRRAGISRPNLRVLPNPPENSHA